MYRRTKIICTIYIINQKDLFHVIYTWQKTCKSPKLTPEILVGMVKQPSDHAGSEFLMSNEDFPALPGAPGNRYHYFITGICSYSAPIC